MRVLSGIQPTGNLHLGNYLGAIRNWVRMQDEMDSDSQCFFFLADMHSITVHEGREARIRNVRDMAAALVAAGIDPDRSVLFNQARVPAHAELCWLLNGTARIGWLNRMTQFKDKVGKDREGASIGLFVYPVLQAADILLYNATHVPVGEDQKQHLELARDIAQKFNNDFATEDAPVFTLPDPYIPEDAARIMSLRDGTKKMSKSDPSELSRIALVDDADMIAKKIKKAKTDLLGDMPSEVDGLEGRPEVENLVGIYAALSGESVEAILKQYGGQGFGVFKPALAEVTVNHLSPITQRYREILDDPAFIDSVLQDGAERADAISAPVIAEVWKLVGFWGA